MCSPRNNSVAHLPAVSILEDGRQICDYCGVPNHATERRSLVVKTRTLGPCDTCDRGWSR
jgi:hypothetical protein